VIAKAVYARVPERPVLSDQYCFDGYDEIGLCLLKDYEPAAETTDFQVLDLLDIPRVFSQPTVQ